MRVYIELLKACQEGNHKKVKKLLAICKGISDIRDLTDKTVLHYCFKDESCSELILEVAPDLLDVGDKAGYTILHLASMSKPPKSLPYILSKNPDVNKQNNDSRSPLLLAVIYENYEAIKLLCEHGADVNVIDSSGISPLHYTAKAKSTSEENEQIQIIDLLLENNANIDFYDFYNRTPLMWAVCSNNIAKMRHLIDKGANIKARDINGLSLLHYSTSNNNREIICILIDEYKLDIEMRDNNDCSALMYACTMSNLDIVQLLLEKSANPNSRDTKLRNCAHFVCSKGELKCLQLLFKYNTNLWQLNIDNNYPLHEAAYHGHISIVQFLIEHFPENENKSSIINQKNSNNQTPLHLSSVKDQIEICRMLLENGADPNITLRATNGRSMSALDLANEAGTKTVIAEFNGKTAEHLIKRLPIKEENTISVETDSSTSSNEQDDDDDFDSSSNITSDSSDSEDDCGKSHSSTEISNSKHIVQMNTQINITKDDVINATLNGDIELIEKYRKNVKESLTDIIDSTGKTLMHYSLKNDLSFDYICNNCEELINKYDLAQITPLGLAIMSKSNLKINRLLQLNSDVNLLDSNGRNVLHLSVIYGNLEALQLMFEWCKSCGDIGKIKHFADYSGNYPLHYAVELVKSRADIEENEQLALSYVEILLKMNCDVECSDFVNRTPLLLAVNVNSLVLVMQLLETHPNILAKDNQGLTSIHYVSAEGDIDILNALAQSDQFDCNTRDPNGLTPLFYAVASCKDKIMKRLIELGADLTVIDKQGRNIVHKAAEKGAFICLDQLVDCRVNCWLQSNDGTVPLHEAAYRGYKEIAQILLNNRPEEQSIDVKNMSGHTCLHLAAARNDCPMCYLLIEHGSNVNEMILDANINKMVTPYDLAQTQDCKDILKQFGGTSALLRQASENNSLVEYSDSMTNTELICMESLDNQSNIIKISMNYLDPVCAKQVYPLSERSTEFALSTIPPSGVVSARNNSITHRDGFLPNTIAVKESESVSTSNDKTSPIKHEGCEIETFKLLENLLLESKELSNSEQISPKSDDSLKTSELKSSHHKTNSHRSSSVVLSKENTKLSVTSSNLSDSTIARSKAKKLKSNRSNNSKVSCLTNTSGSSVKNPVGRRTSSNSSYVGHSSKYIEDKVKNSISNYEYVRFNAQCAINIARYKIRKENIEKLINSTTPKLIRKSTSESGPSSNNIHKKQSSKTTTTTAHNKNSNKILKPILA